MSASGSSVAARVGFGHDNTLAVCARLAAQALMQDDTCPELTGKARECYFRLLMLVSCMSWANGHNSEQVWAAVQQYCKKVNEQDCRPECLGPRSPRSEPLGLPCADGPGYTTSGAAPAFAMPAEADGSRGGGGAAGGDIVPEPPGKRSRVEGSSGPFVPTGTVAAPGTELLLPSSIVRVPEPTSMSRPAVGAATPRSDPEIEATPASPPGTGDQ